MDDGLLQVVLNAPGASWIAALLHKERTKNEKKDTRERDKSRVKGCRFDCSIVCCFNRPSPLLFKRGLDFPYKTRTQISFQRVEKR